VDGVLSVFTAFGLSSSAGLNAYLPLLVVALLARFTDLITLKPPWDALESWWVIGVLMVLLLIEMLVDKIPAVDSINDVIQTFIRPVAGAVLFAASAGVIGETHPVLAMICGLLVAGGVHAAKATARPVITGTTGGVLNPVVSATEDAVSLVVSVLSILVPALGLILLLAVIVWLIRRKRRRREKPAATW
jgi:glucan phosphoethanolaminetransferase (alkaline phosphatase superfamily)